MPITDISGDLFSSAAPALAHGCNVDGKMSAGLAYIVRRDFPDVYQEYGEACRESDFRVGEVLPVLTSRPSGEPLWLLNLATQDRPGPFARLEWIESALRDSLRFCEEQGLDALATARLGSGIGGLDYFRDVRPVFEKVSAEFPEITLAVYFI
jgi:O-acetyl-ADP-ribose deacetylase (regulator of RNase III)